MYSTKTIEKILLANTRKPLIARKIHFVNKPTPKNDIILVYINRFMPDYIFLYYYTYKEYKRGNFRNSTEKSQSVVWDYIYNKINDENDGYIEPIRNNAQSPYEYPNRQFTFLIYRKEKIISTERTIFPFGDGKTSVGSLYSNKDVLKILKDLLKNGIITHEYKLKIGDNEYSLNELLSNKNMPIKYSKNGNLLMYHGTTKENWEKIKKTGGLKPNSSDNYRDRESFTDSLIYLTTSFNVARSYSRRVLNPNNSVILLVEVPDMDKLYVDTLSMEDIIVSIIHGIARENYHNNNKFFVNLNKNKDVIKFRKQYLELTPDGRDVRIKGLGEHKINFGPDLFNTEVIMKAVLDEDFSIIKRHMQNNERNKYSYFAKLNDDEIDKVLEVLYALYKILVKYYINSFSNDRALRESMNSLNDKHAVAYHGRIPLSYIRGVFDINGNKIE